MIGLQQVQGLLGELSHYDWIFCLMLLPEYANAILKIHISGSNRKFRELLNTHLAEREFCILPIPRSSFFRIANIPWIFQSISASGNAKR